MKIYQSTKKKLPGTQYAEIYKEAFGFYKQIKAKTKRRPYVRAAYFKKDKVFLELFWQHLYEKLNFRDKSRRVKYFSCAVDLIKNSKYEPSSKENPNKKSEILHRFAGMTKDKDLFFVQIKEDKKNGEKWLMSVFPGDK